MTGARELIAALGGHWRGSYGMVPCPSHADRSPSLSIRDGATRPLLTCHAGCEQENIVAALKARGLWNNRHSFEPVPWQPPAPKPRPTSNRNRDLALAIWRETRPAPGTLVDLWLSGRGIRFAIPAGIRFHPSLECRAGRPLGRWPAMVVRMDDPAGTFCGVHRTFLDPTIDPNPAGKALVPSPRMSLGNLGVAWLGRRDVEAIVVAEGIETALAASELCSPHPDIPPEPWALTPIATICAAGLARFDPPACVKRLFIGEDDDDAGRKATMACGARAHSRGIAVTILRSAR